MLEQALQAARQRLDEQTALLLQASTRGSDAIRRDQQAAAREVRQLEAELQTIADNLYLRLKASVPADQLDRLNRFFNSQVMTLGPQAFSYTPEKLEQWLSEAYIPGADTFQLPGLAIALASLAPQYDQRTPGQIRERLKELKQLSDNLNRQLEAALALDAAREEKASLEGSVRELQMQLDRYDEWQRLVDGQEERAGQLAELESSLATIEQLLDQSSAESKRLREMERRLQGCLETLRKQHENISLRRQHRGDDAQIFDALTDFPHHKWLGTADIELDQLDATLERYQQDCRSLLQLNERIESRLAELHAGGLTKFQFSVGSEVEIERIIEFAAHLPQEAEALERKARSAVVNVTACLRELRDGLLTFKSKMREFNRLISRRQLSDLAVFKIDPVDETPLVEAIEQLISTAESANNGDTFDLFNHTSVLDDDALNRAKALLIDEGEARGCLRIEHFFRLEFIVGKPGRREESFSDIDSAASNGTVLMAKLVTGLALLHLMQDKRHNVQALCYLDEASALDQRNQKNLIDTAKDFGFALVFASPAPLVTARYCVPISTVGGHNQISRQSWQILEPLEGVEV